MIITRLAGGLGNQIFQLAASAALKNEFDRKIIFDVDSLGNYSTKRELELRKFFCLPEWFVVSSEIGVHGKIASGLMKFRIGKYMYGLGVNDSNFAKKLEAQHIRGNSNGLMVLDGYFQRGWKWDRFDLVRYELEKRLILPSCSEGPANIFDCILHIRGNDFLNSRTAHIVDANYYIRALSLLQDRFEIRTAFVVTDDQDYANQIIKEVTKRLNGIYITVPDQATGMFDDFMCLRNARCRVIGNSTFAWWAAALDAKHSITVSPDQWEQGLQRNLSLPWEILLDI